MFDGFFAQIAGHVGCDHWLVNEMVNRGQDPRSMKRRESQNFPTRWLATDAGIIYELRSNVGVAPGLFLDQSANRRRLGSLASGARVLNLFAYTCSFSLVAARNGAISVTSVDVSKQFLDWGAQNFALNEIDPGAHIFWRGDARDYVRLAIKRGWLFDYIILDPPSFSRSKGKIFQVECELSELAARCFDLLATDGELLVSTNLRTWSSRDLRKALAVIPGCELRAGDVGDDISDREGAAKSYWLKRSSL